MRFDESLRCTAGEVIGEMISQGELPADIDVPAKANCLAAYMFRVLLHINVQRDRYANGALARDVDAFLDELLSTTAKS